MMFVNSGGKRAAAGTIKGKAAAKEEASGISATRKMFQAQAATGQGDVQSTAAKLDSMHQNLVCGLQQFGGSFGGVAAEFTSSSLDGKIVVDARRAHRRDEGAQALMMGRGRTGMDSCIKIVNRRSERGGSSHPGGYWALVGRQVGRRLGRLRRRRKLEAEGRRLPSTVAIRGPTNLPEEPRTSSVERYPGQRKGRRLGAANADG